MTNDKCDLELENQIETILRRAIGEDRKQLAEWVGVPCQHPSHSPPMMMVYTEGYHTHACPACKKVHSFYVRKNYTL